MIERIDVLPAQLPKFESRLNDLIVVLLAFFRVRMTLVKSIHDFADRRSVRIVCQLGMIHKTFTHLSTDFSGAEPGDADCEDLTAKQCDHVL